VFTGFSSLLVSGLAGSVLAGGDGFQLCAMSTNLA
jgi:hypothetical protein